MKVFIVLAALAAVACADYSEGSVDLTQDTLGNYNLKYDTKESSRTEQRFEDGKVIGSYSFIDTDGNKHIIKYVAAKNEGFHAVGDSIPVADNTLPTPVQDTAAVAHARYEHLAVFAQEQALHPHGIVEEKPVPVHAVLASLAVPQIATLPALSVPEEPQENAEAKAELLSAYAAALARLAEEYKRL